MNIQKKCKVKKADGSIVEMSYYDVCKDLGYIPELEFINITSAGTISFYLIKPDEICPLISAVKSKGYVPSKKLLDAAKRR